jgi:hypothetical protein
MKSIITTYPDFHALPKGIKRMLLTSESFFFSEASGQRPQVSLNLGSRCKTLSHVQPSPPVSTPASIFGSAWKN